MTKSIEEVRKIAHLARLEITDSDLAGFAAQFERILEHFTSLDEIDTSGIDATSYILSGEQGTPLRPDRVAGSLDIEDVMRSAPAHSENQFRVPRVIE